MEVAVPSAAGWVAREVPRETAEGKALMCPVFKQLLLRPGRVGRVRVLAARTLPTFRTSWMALLLRVSEPVAEEPDGMGGKAAQAAMVEEEEERQDFHQRDWAEWVGKAWLSFNTTNP